MDKLMGMGLNDLETRQFIEHCQSIKESYEDNVVDFAESFIVPAYISYASWILKDAQRRGLKKLYFLNRDCYIIWKIAEVLNDGKIELEYLFLSRSVLSVPFLRNGDVNRLRLISGLSGEYYVWKIKDEDIAFRLNMTKKELAEEYSLKCGSAYGGSVAEVDKFVEDIFACAPLMKKIKEEGDVQFHLLKTYLHQSGILDSSETCGIVDIGWTGTSRAMLTTLLNEMGICNPPLWYYFGADDYIRAGFLSALIKEAEGYDITTESSMLDKEWIGKKIADYADTEGRSMLGTAVWGKLYDRDFVIKSGVRFDESVRFGEDTLFNLNIWSKAVSIKALHSNLYVHTVDRTRRYELSAQEIRQKIEALRMAYAQLDDAFGSHTDTIRDVNITLSLYPLSKIIEDDEEYMLLYKEYDPNTSEQDFFNDLRCSPVIRAISEAGIVASHYGLKGLRQMFKSISQTYHNQIPLIICPFRMHRIILWFLRHKMYMYCAMIVMLSNSMRNYRV